MANCPLPVRKKWNSTKEQCNNNNGNFHFIQYKSQVRTQINIDAKRMNLQI